MEKKMSCDDVAGGDGQEEAEMVKFFELLAKLREARKRLRVPPSQVMKTTKSFDDLYVCNNNNNNSIEDVESYKGTKSNTSSDHDIVKKRKVSSEGPSNGISSSWIASFQKEDFFTSNRQSSCDHSTSPKGQNSNMSLNDNCINEQLSKRHHEDKPLDGRLNLNLTL